MREKSNLELDDELRPEYDLSQLLQGGVRGKYAERYRAGTNLVLLDPDVAQAFPDAEAVNEALRIKQQMNEILSIEKRTEMALEALKRSDDAVRYAESKAGFLVGYIGLLLGLLADKLSDLITSLSSGNLIIIVLVAIAMFLIVTGILITLISAIQVIYPRLKITPNPSFIYFGSVADHSKDEEDFVRQFASLNAVNASEQILSQVYATSIIASRKFKYVNRMLTGAVIYSSGWLMALIIRFMI